jgi:hypothetical protein
MRDTSRLFASSAAIIVLALGLLLKAERYGPSKAPDFASFEANLTALLSNGNWQRVAAPQSPSDAAYHTLTFRHPACREALHILMLGYTADLVPLVRTRFSDDLTLIQSGRHVKAFDSRALQIENLWNAIGRSIALVAERTPPLIAVSPALDAIAKTCPNSRPPALTNLSGRSD